MAVYALTWLPEVLEAAGLKVAEAAGWRERGRADMTNVRGVMCHHTATPRDGNMPTLGLLIAGRPATNDGPGLAGPLAQLGLGRDGTFYVVAAGRANHAGVGRWEGLVNGNSSFIGIEAEHSGRPADPWPDVQMDAYRRGVAALLRKIGAQANMCCGHKEYALPAGRKPDPTFDMASFRNEVTALLSGKTPPPLIPAVDDKQRPTLRRGARGARVDELQRLLGLPPDGVFGADTEAAARQFQRTVSLVPDGIVGPKTWTALDAAPRPALRLAAAASSAPAAAIAAAAPAPGALPPADDSTRAPRLEGKIAFTPDGRRFASRSGPGYYTTGETTLAQWLAALPAPPDGVSASVINVVRAMCINEGGLEAINSYDGCHLSFGIFQWTAGLADEPGELPILLRDLKAADEAAYVECFGRYGLQVNVNGPRTGSFVLDGTPLRRSQDKDVLRNVTWAYRFWRAGHHPAMRRCQFSLAARRIAMFATQPTAGHPLRDWMTSELGIALVLDEHVNRPGHVPKTLETAIATLGANSPAGWTGADEHRLIDAYLGARAATSMTDSDKRAAKITDFVRTAMLSDERDSFVG
jgi:peptidoglycan hydrolase-like protein with peptidoglycan-binding domain